MKKLLAVLFLLWAGAAQAQTPPNSMTASSAIIGSQIVWCPIGSSADYKCTFTQIATFIQSTLGTAALANTGTSGATLGLLNTANTHSATQTFSAITLTGASGCATFSSGVLSSTGSACGGSGSTGANPSATAGPAAVNGSATTFMRSDAAPAVQLGTGSAPGLVQCGLGLTCASGIAGFAVNATANTATTDTITSAMAGQVRTESNASAVAVSIAQAGTTGFASGQYWTIKNLGAGTVTITPTTSTIDGAATLTLTTNQSVDIYSNGTNYITLPGRSTGSGVTSIASGAQALGTTAVASGACSSAVAATATGVATTDRITANFNADPTAVTGYLPSTNGGLSIYVYPTTNTVNFKYCNSTAASITPGAVTINWAVVR